MSTIIRFSTFQSNCYLLRYDSKEFSQTKLYFQAHEIYVSRIYQPQPKIVNGNFFSQIQNFSKLFSNFSSGKRSAVESLELSFPVTATHFHNNKVRLKCLATIAGNSEISLYIWRRSYNPNFESNSQSSSFIFLHI